MRGRTNSMWLATTIESPSPATLADFYHQLLDWPIVHVDEASGHVILKAPEDNFYLTFQPSPDYVAPVWPPEEGAQRMMSHLDIEVADLATATEDAVALGARVVDDAPTHPTFSVLTDPDGHPFCLCVDG